MRLFPQQHPALHSPDHTSGRAWICGVFTSIAIACPGMASACSVCFGARHDPQMKSALLGVGVLLGLVVAVLLAFAAFAVYLVRRSRMAAHAQEVRAT
jgi:hypothetical protein